MLMLFSSGSRATRLEKRAGSKKDKLVFFFKIWKAERDCTDITNKYTVCTMKKKYIDN